MDKKILLYDAGGDLEKRWFVYYYRNGNRVKKYGRINRLKTPKRRYAAAKKLIAELEVSLGYRTIQRSDTKWEEAQRWVNEKQCRINTKRAFTYILNSLFRYLEDNPLTNENVKKFFTHLEKTSKRTTHDIYLGYVKTINYQCWKIDGLMDGIKRNCRRAETYAHFPSSMVRYISKRMPKYDERMWLFCQFIFYCFIRPEELRHLQYDDILLEDERIKIRGEISKNKKTQYVAIPKPFLPILEKEVEQNYKPDSYIFANEAGKVRYRWYFTKRHRKILQDLEIDTTKYKLYSWKHTGAVMAAKAGINIKQLQVQLRHHSLDQVDAYLKRLGVFDLDDLSNKFPAI